MQRLPLIVVFVVFNMKRFSLVLLVLAIGCASKAPPGPWYSCDDKNCTVITPDAPVTRGDIDQIIRKIGTMIDELTKQVKDSKNAKSNPK